MSPNEWRIAGRFVALLISLYSAVVECFKDAKVPLEILDWLSKDGKEKLQEAVKGLISKYQESLKPVGPIFISFVHMILVPGKKTADCFTNKKRYYYRDVALDRWLPEDQVSEVAGKFSVLKPQEKSTFKKFLDLQIGRETADVAELSTELKRRGYVTVLTRIEALIEEQESGMDVGFRTDGYTNFFLVFDKEGNVSVVRVHLRSRRWGVHFYRLDGVDGWCVDSRLFLRN